jgi:hypothetical protein
METEQKNRACLKRYQELLPGLSNYIDRWTKSNPRGIAIIEYSTGKNISWKDLSRKSKAFAAKLLAMGLRKGDVVATSLPLLKEHIYLIFACFRIGAIVAPLDLRLKEEEIDRYFKKIKPKAYFFLGKTPAADFRPIVTALHQRHRDQIPHWIQFQKEADLLIPGVGVGIVLSCASLNGMALHRATEGGIQRGPSLFRSFIRFRVLNHRGQCGNATTMRHLFSTTGPHIGIWQEQSPGFQHRGIVLRDPWQDNAAQSLPNRQPLPGGA